MKTKDKKAKGKTKGIIVDGLLLLKKEKENTWFCV